MKTAISLPDELFRQAERFARHLKKSRSELYRDALREYLARHAPDEITAAMDRVCERVDTRADGFTRAVARRVLDDVEW